MVSKACITLASAAYKAKELGVLDIRISYQAVRIAVKKSTAMVSPDYISVLCFNKVSDPFRAQVAE